MPIKTGTITGVAGANIWIEAEGVSYYAPREELLFSNPYICLRVNFEANHAAQRRHPFANQVRRADG